MGLSDGSASSAKVRHARAFLDPAVAEVPLTEIAVEAFRSQLEVAGPGPWLFPSEGNRTGHQTEFKKAWRTCLRKAKVPYFRLYDLRSTYATLLSAGGLADGG